MFPLHKIPTFITKNKHGNRYNIDLTAKLKIRCSYYNDKLTQEQTARKYDISIRAIRRIIKE